MFNEYVEVRRDAVEWLKKHYPVLCEKAGLCERVGGRLYTRTSSHPLDCLHINKGSMDAAADAYQAEYNEAHGIVTPNAKITGSEGVRVD
ncbi:MAG: hypothetical protein ABIT70_02385 [Sulfuriferula sp.]